MNMDELKSAWNEYDRKLKSTQAISERLVVSMISERSETRFSKVRKHYVLGFAWMFVCLVVAVLVMVTNPFDYRYTLQYIPMAIFALGLILLLADMTKSYMTFRKICITHHTVDEALKRIIAVYEKPKKFIHYTIILFLFSQVVLFPLSFLPRNIENTGLWSALAERLIPITIGALLLLLALKLGAFKERNANKFKEDLSELESLKKMSAELQSDE